MKDKVIMLYQLADSLDSTGAPASYGDNLRDVADYLAVRYDLVEVIYNEMME